MNNLNSYLETTLSNVYNQYTSNYNNVTVKENTILYLDLLGEYITQVDWGKVNILNYIINFLNRNEISDIYLKANAIFQNIISHYVVFSWSFIDS